MVHYKILSETILMNIGTMTHSENDTVVTSSGHKKFWRSTEAVGCAHRHLNGGQ